MAQYKFNYQTSSDVEKITHVAAMTLDDIQAYIDQILDAFDVENCPIEHLNIIANILGYPLDREDDPDFVRRSLRNAISLYKSKGTEESIKVLFYNLGFYVDVVPLWTPDFVETIEVTPPYIRASVTANPSQAGFYNVTVINPDEQSYTSTGAFQVQ